jgi:LPXTG-site transpeptidase (sortase) family protein
MHKLRKFNNFLSLIVVLLGLYIAIAPFLPQISFWLRNTSPEYVAPYAGELANSEDSNTSLPPPIDNRIVIPSIGINEPIKESNSIDSISSGGTWRRPNTATPEEYNNTVIVGHRYFGSEVSTFYHLDKVKIGELLAVYWNGKETLYEVTETKVVPANAVEIEASTTEKQLTLYTCTPLWTAKDRLVVIAKPVDSIKANLSEDI